MTLCLLAGTSAFAQDRRAPRTKERPTAEQMAQRKTDRMVEKLNLNEDQSKQLYELNLQEVKDMQAQHERMRSFTQCFLLELPGTRPRRCKRSLRPSSSSSGSRCRARSPV